MKNLIKSFALLKVMLDHDPKINDYLDIFIPFLVTLIKKRNLKNIRDIQLFCIEFQKEYGLLIPHHPMVALINRLISLGYVNIISQTEFGLNYDKINTDNFISEALRLDQLFDELVQKFITFSKEKHNFDLNYDDATNALLLIIEDHDLDLLFVANEQRSITSFGDKLEESKNLAYDFVRKCYELQEHEFEIIADIAFGQIIANTIIIGTNLPKENNIHSVEYYLDTGILFGLFGINGDYEKKVYDQFIRLLKSHKGSVFIFNHTYTEFINIIERCKNWIDNPYYDPIKANRTLVYFKSQGWHCTDIDIFIARIPKILSLYGIIKIDAPNPNNDIDHQISEEDFQTTLIKKYKSFNPYFDEEDKEGTIYLDVQSVSAIHKLRKGNIPRNLWESRCVFITRNSTLAYASKIFERSISSIDYFYIPITVTDVFIGTMIWLTSPLSVDLQEISKTRLIANCYAALHPSKATKKLFIAEVEKAKNDNLITSDEIVVLKVSNIAEQMLQETTLGNPQKISTQTAVDIMAEIRSKAKTEATKEFDEIRNSLEIEITQSEEEKNMLVKKLEDTKFEKEQKEKERDAEINKMRKVVEKLKKKKTKNANIQSWVMIIFFFLVVVGVNVLPIFELRLKMSLITRILISFFSACLSFISFLFNCNLKNLKDKYIQYRVNRELLSLEIDIKELT